MNLFEEKYTLANGVQIPKLALGTWLIDNKAAAGAIDTAILIRRRHTEMSRASGRASENRGSQGRIFS